MNRGRKAPATRDIAAEAYIGSSVVYHVWIIPACAGNTRRRPRPTSGTRNHPRMRGEHRLVVVVQDVARGIIPACAGNTSSKWSCTGGTRDHPRMRGEHDRGHKLHSRAGGSSPHARGTPASVHHVLASTGIIPACAGNTTISTSATFGARDHPRMRGEHSARHRVRLRVPGSSPHARGTLPVDSADAPEHGIIPACAGNTGTATYGRPSSGDHPRMRGEHPLVRMARVVVRGSSPHARGTLGRVAHLVKRDGIIPACAGNTASVGRPNP